MDGAWGSLDYNDIYRISEIMEGIQWSLQDSPNFKRVRPLSVIFVIPNKCFIVPFKPKRVVTSYHFLTALDKLIVVEQQLSAPTWKLEGVCSKIQFPAWSAVILLV
jgi:hypothetical protein